MRTFLFLLLLISEAVAGGRGGHNKTFDPNSYGGGWTTITCNNVDADSDAILTWKNAAIAANPALAKVRFVGTCKVTDTIDNRPITGITNVIVWGYGAAFTRAVIGGSGYDVDTANAFVQTANIGDTVVTVVTPGEASRFSVGDWVCVCALSTQDFGYPPNFQLFEYRLVTAVSGDNVTLNAPLTQQYLSTYPLMTVADHTVAAGPVKLFRMYNVAGNTWITNYQILGMTFMDQGSQYGFTGRTVQLVDVVILDGNGLVASASENTFISYSAVQSSEFDKEVDYLSLYRVTGNQFLVQSASINNMVVTSSRTTNRTIGFTGAAKNTTIIDNYFPRFFPGASYGYQVSLTLDGSFTGGIPSSDAAVPYIPNGLIAAEYTYSAGTFTTPNTDPFISFTYQSAVPGKSYYFSGNDGSNVAVPNTTFRVTSVTQSGSNVLIATDNWQQSGSPIATPSTLPSVTCAGVQCPQYSGFPATTIKQKFPQAGSADFTSYAAPP